MDDPASSGILVAFTFTFVVIFAIDYILQFLVAEDRFSRPSL